MANSVDLFLAHFFFFSSCHKPKNVGKFMQGSGYVFFFFTCTNFLTFKLTCSKSPQVNNLLVKRTSSWSAWEKNSKKMTLKTSRLLSNLKNSVYKMNCDAQ